MSDVVSEHESDQDVIEEPKKPNKIVTVSQLLGKRKFGATIEQEEKDIADKPLTKKAKLSTPTTDDNDALTQLQDIICDEPARVLCVRYPWCYFINDSTMTVTCQTVQHQTKPNEWIGLMCPVDNSGLKHISEILEVGNAKIGGLECQQMRDDYDSYKRHIIGFIQIKPLKNAKKAKQTDPIFGRKEGLCEMYGRQMDDDSDDSDFGYYETDPKRYYIEIKKVLKMPNSEWIKISNLDEFERTERNSDLINITKNDILSQLSVALKQCLKNEQARTPVLSSDESEEDDNEYAADLVNFIEAEIAVDILSNFLWGRKSEVKDRILLPIVTDEDVAALVVQVLEQIQLLMRDMNWKERSMAWNKVSIRNKNKASEVASWFKTGMGNVVAQGFFRAILGMGIEQEKPPTNTLVYLLPKCITWAMTNQTTFLERVQSDVCPAWCNVSETYYYTWRKRVGNKKFWQIDAWKPEEIKDKIKSIDSSSKGTKELLKIFKKWKKEINIDNNNNNNAEETIMIERTPTMVLGKLTNKSRNKGSSNNTKFSYFLLFMYF